MSKILICYFSATGTTKNYANKLAELLNADLYEIKPVVKYSQEDLNWQNEKSRSSLEMSNPKARTELIKDLNNLDQYDKIVLGFPIWWYTAPRIINSFLEAYDFSNKSIYIWATSGSSKMGRIVKELEKTYPSIKFIEGQVINHIDEKEMNEFIQRINN